MTCEPFFQLLKKEVPIVWNEQCQEVFEKIKNYLMKPPILVPPVLEKPLLLYLTTTNTTMGALLAQYLEEFRKENAIYYISKKMLAYEEKYSPLEKTCVTLVWATYKLRHYMLAFKVFFDCKNGSFEVFDGKACVRWEDSKMGFDFVRI